MNANMTLYRMILLTKRICDHTDHHVSVEYAAKRDEVSVSIYRGGFKIGARNTLEEYRTSEHSLETIYAILMDLDYESTNTTRRMAVPREKAASC